MASFDEMEAKRQMMITSFTQIANAMRQCVACIEDYTRHDPGNIPNRATTQQALAQLQSNFPQGIEAIDPRLMDQSAPSQTPVQTQAPTTAPSTKKAKTPAPEKPAKKEKKIKDPNQPKRPASAYILYQNDVRPTLQSSEAEMSYLDAMKKVSGMWKELTPAQKKPYEEKYAKAIEEYQQKDKAYKAGQGNESVAPGTVDPSALSGNRAAAASSDSSDSSDSSSDSSDDEPPPPPAPKVKAPKPAAVPPTPTTLAAATSTPKTATKEKKRKHKDVAAGVAGTPMASAGTSAAPVTGEKKKKKKNKE